MFFKASDEKLVLLEHSYEYFLMFIFAFEHECVNFSLKDLVYQKLCSKSYAIWLRSSPDAIWG